MRLDHLTMVAYGECDDVRLDLGAGLTVVLGVNEAGKSTALDALTDFLWGIPSPAIRVSTHARAKLRIEGGVTVDDASTLLIRKAAGLLDSDGVAVAAPWDPGSRSTREWWRTRFGIDHDRMRAGGAEVIDGGGTNDLAELVFAAREGHSARRLQAAITAEIDAIYKLDGRAKNAKLRLAKERYDVARKVRDERVIKADTVASQRLELEALNLALTAATAALREALERRNAADEDRRAVEHVIALRKATDDLGAIDASGNRLAVGELEEFDQATLERAHTTTELARISSTIEDLRGRIDALEVDETLLDDEIEIERLAADLQARLSEMERVQSEIRPAIEARSREIRDLLASIGIGAGSDEAAAIAAARIRADHAATLNELADRIEDLQALREGELQDRERALESLAERGIVIDLEASEPPQPDDVAAARDRVKKARESWQREADKLATASTQVQKVRSASGTSASSAGTTRDDVMVARRDRDESWMSIRLAWISGQLPEQDERVVQADGVTSHIALADQVSDEEAVGRARVAADEATLAAHDLALREAQEDERIQSEATSTAALKLTEASDEWEAAWLRTGLTAAPTLDEATDIAALLVTAHAADAAAGRAAAQCAELDLPWQQGAALVDLAPGTTPAAWRTQEEILTRIAALEAERTGLVDADASATRRWDQFSASVCELLVRHGEHDVDATAPTSTDISRGLAALGRRLKAELKSRTTAGNHADSIAAAQIDLDAAVAEQRDADLALARIAGLHSDDVDDLALLAERARLASDPLERIAASQAGLRAATAASPGPALDAVIARLEGRVETDVEIELAEADEAYGLAESAKETALARRTTAQDELRSLESASGAEEAQADLLAAQADVVRLTETWARLVLQRRLLDDLVASYGSEGARPLLEHAGRLLARLTGGRWVGLTPVEVAGRNVLRIRRADGEPAEAQELSEGTRDQAYLALRLAAVAQLHRDRIGAGEPAVPLVLDDVLIAFDDARTADALEVLADLADGLQVIVFTHHRHVADLAERLDTATVARLPVPKPMVGA